MHIKHIYFLVIGGSKTHPNFWRGGGLRFFMNLTGGPIFFAPFKDRDLWFVCAKNGNSSSPVYDFDLSLIYTLCSNFIPVGGLLKAPRVFFSFFRNFYFCLRFSLNYEVFSYFSVLPKWKIGFGPFPLLELT